MKFKMQKSDEGQEFKETLKEIKAEISNSLLVGNTLDNNWSIASLQYLLSKVEELQDENESLWFMIDELKASTWKKEHSEELNTKIQNHLTLLKLAQMQKGEA